MPTIQTQIKARFLALIPTISGFGGSGNVVSYKTDVYERPTGSVYLGSMESTRISSRESFVERDQSIIVTLSDTVAQGVDAEEHMLALGEALEAAIEADRVNMPADVEINFSSQDLDVNPDAATTAVISQLYVANWPQSL